MLTGSRLAVTEAPIGIIAGSGDLPEQLAQHLVSTGRQPVVLGISGYASSEFLERIGGTEVSIGELGRQITLFRKAACKQIVFAGVVRRPDFSKLRLDIKGTTSLPKLLSAATKGDESLLRAVIEIFEAAGFEVLGSDELFGGLLVKAGAMGKLSPRVEDWLDIRCAATAALELGKLDIGQGAVACRGLVLAAEAQEGTDNMLERCALLPQNIRGSEVNRAGVLVKRPKPQQDMRIDLPTIGVATIQRAAIAGLAGIAVQADTSLAVDPTSMIHLADELGLFVYGFTPEELA